MAVTRQGARRASRAARPWAALVVAAVCGANAPGSFANDRPYLLTTHAVAEEDDDNVWSIEFWAQRRGPVRALSVAPEYAFDPTNSLQIELTRARDRGATETEREVEIEFKHLFNRIGREGWGWGIDMAIGFERAEGAGWRAGSLGLRLPYTLKLCDGAGHLHLNVGVEKPRHARHAVRWSAALEREVVPRTTLFGEAGRAADGRLLHGGLRWWVKRERFAVDLGAQRWRHGDERASGLVFGVGWYDL